MADQDMDVMVAQMRKEAEEYRADSARMSLVLSSVNITPRAGNIDAIYLESLGTAAEALDISMPDKENLILGISDLKNESDTATDVLESGRQRIHKYKTELPNILKQREWWQKVLDRLEAEENDQQQEFTKMYKSTRFHSKKRSQYEGEVASSKSAMSSAGYEQSLSHESLVKLSGEIKDMEECLKPLRLQLNSYRDLPPSLTQARVKLEEKRSVAERLEKEFTETLGEVSIKAPIT